MAPATLHLVLLAGWAGVVATEAVIELLPLVRPQLRPAAAVFHYYIDLVVELPVLLGVAVTGAALLAGRPMDARLAAKVVAGAAAIAANLVCVLLVVARHRGPADRLAARSRLVFVSAGVGLPGAAAAFYLGAGYAGWLR